MKVDNNGSDKNVGSIEEDIFILEQLINTTNTQCYVKNFSRIDLAIEHLIKAYKEREEEKGWLLEEVNYLNEEKWKDFEFFVNSLSKTIPKSKIKEKIEELNKKEKEEIKGLKGQDRYFVKQIYQAMRKSLEELLEGE